MSVGFPKARRCSKDQALRLLCNVSGGLKYVAGMCADKLPHEKIWTAIMAYAHDLEELHVLRVPRGYGKYLKRGKT